MKAGSGSDLDTAAAAAAAAYATGMAGVRPTDVGSGAEALSGYGLGSVTSVDVKAAGSKVISFIPPRLSPGAAEKGGDGQGSIALPLILAIGLGSLAILLAFAIKRWRDRQLGVAGGGGGHRHHPEGGTGGTHRQQQYRSSTSVGRRGAADGDSRGALATAAEAEEPVPLLGGSLIIAAVGAGREEPGPGSEDESRRVVNAMRDRDLEMSPLMRS